MASSEFGNWSPPFLFFFLFPLISVTVSLLNVWAATTHSGDEIFKPSCRKRVCGWGGCLWGMCKPALTQPSIARADTSLCPCMLTCLAVSQKLSFWIVYHFCKVLFYEYETIGLCWIFKQFSSGFLSFLIAESFRYFSWAIACTY